jgi:hypothetical protein
MCETVFMNLMPRRSVANGILLIVTAMVAVDTRINEASFPCPSAE